MIPFSVALEDRLSKMTEEDAAEECKKLGTKSALPRIAVSGTVPLRLMSITTQWLVHFSFWKCIFGFVGLIFCLQGFVLGMVANG